MKFGNTLAKLRQHSRRNTVNNSKKSNSKTSKSKNKLTKQQQPHQLFDSDGEEEPGNDVLVGQKPQAADVDHQGQHDAEPDSLVNHIQEQLAVPAATSVSSTQHTLLTVSVSTADHSPERNERPLSSPTLSSPTLSPSRAANLSPIRPPSLPRQTRSVKQRAFRERLHSLSRDLIQESPYVAAVAAAATAKPAVVVVTPWSVDATIPAATTTTATTTTYDMDSGGISPRSAILTSATTNTSSSRNTSVASPATVPSDLYSASSIGDLDGTDDDDDNYDDASTVFEISHSYDSQPQQQTTIPATSALDIVQGISSNNNDNNHHQQQARDSSSPQGTLLTEGATSTGFSHVASMATTTRGGGNSTIYGGDDATSIYTSESNKTTSSHWVEALTWWGRNPCVVLEELTDMWEPEESTIISKAKTKSRGGAVGTGGMWFKWLPKWHIASHGEEMRFNDCTNSVIRASDQDSSTHSRIRSNNRKRVASTSSKVGAAASAAVASNILFSNMAACHTSSTSSSTPSQEGFERQVSAAPEQSREEYVVGPSYVEEEGGVTVPVQVIATIGKGDQREASGASADRGIRMSPSDASTITSGFSFH